MQVNTNGKKRTVVTINEKKWSLKKKALLELKRVTT